MSEIINAMFSLKQNARIKLRVLFTELEPSQSPFRGRECSSERLFFLSRGQKLYYRQIHLETLKRERLISEGRQMPGEQHSTESEFWSLHLGFRGVCHDMGAKLVCGV